MPCVLDGSGAKGVRLSSAQVKHVMQEPKWFLHPSFFLWYNGITYPNTPF